MTNRYQVFFRFIPSLGFVLRHVQKAFFKSPILLGFLCLILSGCYSFTASTLPSHIKTVHIYEVEDKTLDPVLANNLRAGILELFRKNAGSVRIVNDEASADFKVTLLNYSNRPDNYNSADQVETDRKSVV